MKSDKIQISRMMVHDIWEKIYDQVGNNVGIRLDCQIHVRLPYLQYWVTNESGQTIPTG